MAPIDMVNIKNIQNLMILRKMAFTMYQPLAMIAQKFLILCFLVFFFGAYVLFSSIFYTPTTPNNPMAYFYGMYPPKEMWFYFILFSVFYFIPICFCFIIIFWFEMNINNYFIQQSNLWYDQSQIFARISNFGSHYFEQPDGPGNPFTLKMNAIYVIKKHNENDDRLFTEKNYDENGELSY